MGANRSMSIRGKLNPKNGRQSQTGSYEWPCCGDVTALHASTIALASVGLAPVGIAAAMLPAWRGSLVDPNLVLRAD